MPITESARRLSRTQGVKSAPGKNGSAKRRKPYVPILSMIPARITEPAVGASTCASGSHVWKGNIGTFTAKARKKAPKISSPARPATGTFSSVSYEKLDCDPAFHM